ncbi:MAG: IS3 family transposase [Treponema sp.]|nr:IS3 family transposase [Treponema sp.]
MTFYVFFIIKLETRQIVHYNITRQECPDHFVIFTENRLRNVLKSYIDYYNKYRPHQGLHGSLPCQYHHGYALMSRV